MAQTDTTPAHERASASDLLIADLEHFGESMWRNEEVGEKRLSFFVTVATAVAGGLVALKTSQTSLPEPEFRRIAGVAMGVLFVVGVLTYLRMIQRHYVKNEYHKTLGYIRKSYAALCPDLDAYKVPRRGPDTWVGAWLRGGYAETMAVLDGIILAGFLVLGAQCGMLVSGLFGLAVAIALWVSVRPLAGESRDSGPACYFRAGVGAVIADHQSRVLVFERSKTPGAWQFPQGGLELDEEPGDAVVREIREETGFVPGDVELVARYPGLLAYELPPQSRGRKTGRGQVQHWFLFRLRRPVDPPLPGKGEFQRWAARPFDQAVAEAAPFRRPVYEKLLAQFGPLLGGPTNPR